MRWVLLLSTLLSVGGCTRPNDEFDTPFLLLRTDREKIDKRFDSPDGGSGEIEVVPVDDPGQPGGPVDVE
jgi:hypothetical protein